MHPAWSLLPPAVALAVAFGTRRVLLALGAGALTGYGLLGLDQRGAVGLLEAPVAFVGDGLLGQASTAGNAQVLVLVALIAGFVGRYEACGAAAGLVQGLSRIVTTPRRAEAATFLGGLALFFSDTGNVLLLGPLFRPVFDRLGVARERLAWVVDSTAAPVSVLVPFITWGVYVTGLLDASYGDGRGLELFARAWPHQLYPWLCLLFVLGMATVGRPFGPMASASGFGTADDEAAEGGFATGLVPLLVLLIALGAVGSALWVDDGVLRGPDVRLALGCGYLAAIGALWAMAPGPDFGRDVLDGMGGAMRLLVLLVLAWSLGAVCKTLGTGDALAALLGPWLPAALVPVGVFGVGALVSFATGTSWGTFAILLPLTAPLAEATGLDPALLIGAVLSGGIFGDHSSPISDTTLLASAACGVDHGEHVRTQLPYALAVGACAALGFVASGLVGWGLAFGAAGVVAVVAGSRLPGAAAG